MIAHHYNLLLDKIASLISENVRRETAQMQTQLMALQYQMNPHFIYNTLHVFLRLCGPKRTKHPRGFHRLLRPTAPLYPQD